MAQKFVGIDLGSHQVKCVVATAGLRGVQVLNTYQAAVEPQQDLEDALAASAAVAVGLLREQGLTHLPVGVCLPGALGSYRVLKFPFSDQKRVSQALAFEIDGQFPLPVTELERTRGRRAVQRRRLMGEEGLDGPVLFLCSDEAEYVTGANFVLDDGQTL